MGANAISDIRPNPSINGFLPSITEDAPKDNAIKKVTAMGPVTTQPESKAMAKYSCRN